MALPIITLKAPIAGLFTALWRSNERSFERKVGVFEAPGLLGSITQDKGAKSTIYPINLTFTGPLHNIIATGFFEACRRQPGKWIILHPEKGLLRLQLLKITEVVDPVGDASAREFQTEWIEPAELNPFLSALQAAVAAGAIFAATIAAILDIVNELTTRSASTARASAATAATATDAATTSLETVVNDDSQMAADFQEAATQVATSGAALVNDPTNAAVLREMAAALVDVMIIASDAPAPAEVSDDTEPVQPALSFERRANAYGEMLDDLYELLPDNVTEESRNTVLTLEMSILAALAAYTRVVTTSEFKTRTQVVEALEKMTAVFDHAVEKLETIQDNFKQNEIDRQYIAVSTAFTQIQQLFTITSQYLMTLFFNLRAEKRFILQDWRSPLELTVTEYGDLGENDENYDLFLDSNNLTGSEIEILPPGKQVVVYVA